MFILFNLEFSDEKLNKETESILNSLKRHYMTFYWKVRNDFLDYIEDSMSQ
jgi:hypothetical protein